MYLYIYIYISLLVQAYTSDETGLSLGKIVILLSFVLFLFFSRSILVYFILLFPIGVSHHDRSTETQLDTILRVLFKYTAKRWWVCEFYLTKFGCFFICFVFKTLYLRLVWTEWGILVCTNVSPMVSGKLKLSHKWSM